LTIDLSDDEALDSHRVVRPKEVVYWPIFVTRRRRRNLSVLWKLEYAFYLMLSRQSTCRSIFLPWQSFRATWFMCSWWWDAVLLPADDL